MRTKRAELPTNLEGIRSAEAAYYAEFETYTSADPAPSIIPQKEPIDFGYSQGDGSSWDLLGFMPDGKVYGMYSALAIDSSYYSPEYPNEYPYYPRGDLPYDGEYPFLPGKQSNGEAQKGGTGSGSDPSDIAPGPIDEGGGSEIGSLCEWLFSYTGSATPDFWASGISDIDADDECAHYTASAVEKPYMFTLDTVY